MLPLGMVGWRPTYATSLPRFGHFGKSAIRRGHEVPAPHPQLTPATGGSSTWLTSRPLGRPSARRHESQGANPSPSALALSIRLNAIRRPWVSHTATLTIMLSCRAFATAAATIVFASTKVRGHGAKSLVALQAYLEIPHRREVVLHHSKLAPSTSEPVIRCKFGRTACPQMSALHQYRP